MQKPLISLYQRDIRRHIPSPNDKEYRFLKNSLEQSSLFIFPEYFSFHEGLTNDEAFFSMSEEALHWLKELSSSEEAKDTLIIGGSLLYHDSEDFLNSSPAIFNSEVLAWYAKQRLFGHEIGQLKAGHETQIVTAAGIKCGILICADVFVPGIFKKYREADFLAIPTSSPWRPDDTPRDQEKRDRKIFMKGATKSRAMIFKCCAVGQVGGKRDDGMEAPRLQGRSLICDRERVLAKAPHIQWNGIISFNRLTKETQVNEFQF